MTNPAPAEQQIIAAAIEQGKPGEARAALIGLLSRADGAAQLRALDAAGLLTRLMPELEPARHTDQPHVHFLPVLEHSLETVTVVEWLLSQIEQHSQASVAPTTSLPAGIQA